MDIFNNKTPLQIKIKNFTLKATASAVLVFNAEAALAVDCPTEIYGSSLANTICDFNNSSLSVTVENGGAVGGILMENYQPNNSYIDLSNGGLVSNTSNIGSQIF